ncbi:MAG: multidrug efflux SMR transporter [Desulfomonilaceae bacterium]|nr:multidrug efflux SMR transporter [Desulfomonilaceae bacterium]
MKGGLILACAILLEVAGTTCMKLSEGFTKLTPSVLIFVFYGLSFAALTIALKFIDLSVAYAIWAGVGTALIAVVGIAHFGEPISWTKAISVCLIILGVIGLNLTRASH